MNRRLLALGLLSLILSILVACGGGSTDTSPLQSAELDLSSLSVDLGVSDVNSLRDNPNVALIDVREQYEYDEGHIPGVTLIPLGTIPNRLNEIPTDKEVIFVCRSGNRSNQATQFLQQQGFDNVHNMLGGMNAWVEEGYNTER
jgi:rhodanese-related sulfurtransferase